MNIPPTETLAKLVADPKKVKALFDEFDRLRGQLAERRNIPAGQGHAEPNNEKMSPGGDAMACLPTTTNLNIVPAVEMPSAFELICRVVQMETSKDAASGNDAMARADK